MVKRKKKYFGTIKNVASEGPESSRGDAKLQLYAMSCWQSLSVCLPRSSFCSSFHFFTILSWLTPKAMPAISLLPESHANAMLVSMHVIRTLLSFGQAYGILG